MSSGPEYRSAIVNQWAKFDLPISGTAASELRNVTFPVVVADQPLQIPPLLAERADWIQPLSIGDLGKPDTFALPEALQESVSRDQPMRVELSPPFNVTQDAFAVFPVVGDGEFFYFAGPPTRLSGQNDKRTAAHTVHLTVTQLPNLAGLPPTSPSEQRIGVWRALKLGFFKIVGIPTSLTGLRIPSLDGSKVSYRDVEENDLDSGRIALLVHGFLSDTSWLVKELLETLRKSGFHHIVTWDYETYTSSVRSVMADLISQLERAGVQRGAQRLEVIAHSMGSLVTRGLMATDDPILNIVKRAIFLGPPNGGTPIAMTGDVVMDLASSFINAALGPVSLRSVVRYLYEWIDDGIDDLKFDSDFIQWVNRNPNQQTAPITVMAGEAESDDKLGSFLSRALHKSASAFYGGENDLVVPVASMSCIQNFPNVTIIPSKSNHFDYLQPGTGSRHTVERWIEDEGV